MTDSFSSPENSPVESPPSTAKLPSPNTSITPVSFEINAEGVACIGGIDANTLAQQFGTPLYIMDEETIRHMANAYQSTLSSRYSSPFLVLYASKANLNLGLCRLADHLGLGLDVVSGGELFTAVHAKFPMSKIFFNGNNKSEAEIASALSHGVGRITVDNFYELDLIHQVAKARQTQANILLRITPGIECHTHDYIKTGQNDSKFGFDLSTLSEAVELITTKYKNTLCLKGLHAHIGSQIFEIKPYEDLIEILLNIYYNIRETYEGLVLEDLNIGGGMGIAYTQKDDPPNIETALETIIEKLTTYAEKLNYPLPRLMLEPGRSMVATAGVTLYTLGSVKEVPGVRKYVAIDGGMGDNIRPSLYQAEYSGLIANKANQERTETVTIAGKYCESGDLLLKDFLTPPLEAGDLLMVFATGAYNYSMASNYNRIPRPAMVLVENKKAHLLVKRESYEDLLREDLIPNHLESLASSAKA